MNILILGSKGMLGHMFYTYLKTKDYNVFEMNKKDFTIDNYNDYSYIDKIEEFISVNKIEYVVNCIGILNKKDMVDPLLTVKTNSLFPHQLVYIGNKTNCKIVHISTDCWSDLSHYGRTKRAGEINYPNHLTIRTSIIGPELKDGSGLFHWFMKQTKCNGYVNHLWDGVTTLEFARNLIDIIKTKTGIVDMRCIEKISKYDLLKMINSIFNKNIEELQAISSEPVSKINLSPDIVIFNRFEKQLFDLKHWMDLNKDLYKMYY